MGYATLLVGVLFMLPAGAADRESKATFLRHWQVAREFTLAVAEAMPPDGYDFRPNPEQLAFGRLMTHIGGQNSDGCATAAATTALPEPRVTDKPTALKYLAETHASARRRSCVDKDPQWARRRYRPQPRRSGPARCRRSRHPQRRSC